MTDEQKQEMLQALRHGREGDDELDLILCVDIEALEPIVDRWTKAAYDQGVADALTP